MPHKYGVSDVNWNVAMQDREGVKLCLSVELLYY